MRFDRTLAAQGRSPRGAAAARSCGSPSSTPRLRLLGIIAVADPFEGDRREAVRRLHAIGVETVLLTGDNERTATTVAAQVGINASSRGPAS